MSLACMAAAIGTLTGSAAAPRAAEFAVPIEQQRALGIQTAPLQSSTNLKATLPASVVASLGAERVVTLPVAGIVTQVLIQPFQAVRAGEPLMRLASPELGQLQLQLIQAASRAAIASQTAQRERQLFDEGIITERRAQEALAAAKDANATLQQAKAALRLSGMSGAALDRLITSGQPEDAITVTAPSTGVVFEMDVKAGQRVDAAMPLLHLVKSGALDLEIRVPAADALRYPAGTEVHIPGRAVVARIATASPTVASSNQMITLRATVSSGGTALRPGELVQAEVSTKSNEAAFIVPLAAVAYDGKQPYVFVRTAKGFAARPVQIVTNAGQSLLVRGPLQPGESVAVTGIAALKGAWLNPPGTE